MPLRGWSGAADGERPLVGGVGRHAAGAGAISGEELAAWLACIAELQARNRLFCSVGYFLLAART